MEHKKLQEQANTIAVALTALSENVTQMRKQLAETGKTPTERRLTVVGMPFEALSELGTLSNEVLLLLTQLKMIDPMRVRQQFHEAQQKAEKVQDMMSTLMDAISQHTKEQSPEQQAAATEGDEHHCAVCEMVEAVRKGDVRMDKLPDVIQKGLAAVIEGHGGEDLDLSQAEEEQRPRYMH